MVFKIKKKKNPQLQMMLIILKISKQIQDTSNQLVKVFCVCTCVYVHSRRIAYQDNISYKISRLIQIIESFKQSDSSIGVDKWTS